MSSRRHRGRKPGKSRKKDPAIGRELEVEIETIGASGDGIASIDGRPVYVPFSSPGDRLQVRLTESRGAGHAAVIIAEHRLSARATPPCPHFGRCGGCQLQHLQPDDYLTWKEDQIRQALAHQGLTDIEIRPIIQGTSAARRRLRLALSPASGNGKPTRKPAGLGFRERHSSDIVDIEHCVIAHPDLIRLLPTLRATLEGLDLAAKGGEIHLTRTDSGIDLLLETPIPPDLTDLEQLGQVANEQDLARLAWRQDAGSEAEPIAVRRQPKVTMGEIPVPLPIGAFLQATTQAETAIRSAVKEAIGPARRIADLFAGCGAFGLPLAAAGREVLAIERDPAMVAAMRAAAGSANITRHLKADQRDLDRQPLDHRDLDPLDAVIIDPPRAGARAQVDILALTPSPKKIAMVSCNPATFARDARHLTQAGYRLAWVQPIDAFLWSAEIELTAAFHRPTP